ncbi:MAG: hypothetical protein KGM42_09060 [Hyphomicrobiales bacterium]|nr:hypothetical protein [Hyphomicrobiales bacterium]
MALQPFRQGHLDGLCGLYAIVNALDLLRDGGLTHSEDEAHRIMRALVEAVPERFPRAIWDGTKVQHIRRMLDAADRFARKRYKFGLDWSEPFLKRDFRRPADYLAALRAQLGDGGLAIVGLAPPWDHWTLVRKVRDDGLDCVDSIELKFLALKDLHLRKRAKDKPPRGAEFVLDIHQVFVLRRAETGKGAEPSLRGA